jgi:hypothetical protein
MRLLVWSVSLFIDVMRVLKIASSTKKELGYVDR